MITLSIDEGKQLLSLCRAGKLYEVDAWINAGKSLQVPEELRTNPLRVAIDLGFHSLIQLLAIHEDSEAILNDALGAAVDLRSLELVQLLLKHGAQIRGIPIISVLRSWDSGDKLLRGATLCRRQGHSNPATGVVRLRHLRCA